MPEEMRGESSASSDLPVQTSTPAADAEASVDVLPGHSNETREQLAIAFEQSGMHIARMARKAGWQMAEDMWQSILAGLERRLVRHGPVENLDPYLNSCVTKALSKLRTAIEVLVGDEHLDALRQRQYTDPQLDSMLQLNTELVEAARGVIESGVLTKREAHVYVLAQVLGEDNAAVAEWLNPPTTVKAVTQMKYKAVRKVNRAYRQGKFRHLGYEPPHI
ncbi:hypothetical protein JW613_31045 [Streptomyces smyrnaeus]|uniref:Sigma-70 family RNA polymerase sigma factor n=1 Tax=Streptomyces smyrnaeus TaxID=1387713 RepID=A0ABS3Y4U9_9ACTN|nr:hypothetical protein [Streptomyces smyrnaeus]MBO8202683.1 hypothetical protein [Streptomyces smyrnaeus]